MAALSRLEAGSPSLDVARTLTDCHAPPRPQGRLPAGAPCGSSLARGTSKHWACLVIADSAEARALDHAARACSGPTVGRGGEFDPQGRSTPKGALPSYMHPAPSQRSTPRQAGGAFRSECWRRPGLACYQAGRVEELRLCEGCRQGERRVGPGSSSRTAAPAERQPLGARRLRARLPHLLPLGQRRHGGGLGRAGPAAGVVGRQGRPLLGAPHLQSRQEQRGEGGAGAARWAEGRAALCRPQGGAGAAVAQHPPLP